MYNARVHMEQVLFRTKVSAKKMKFFVLLNFVILSTFLEKVEQRLRTNITSSTISEKAVHRSDRTN